MKLKALFPSILKWLLSIFLTASCLFGANIAHAAKDCFQPRLVSLYQSENQGSQYQELVGTVIHWKPIGKNYILTVAHGVANAAKISASCNGEQVEVTVVGIDTDRDVALLEIPPSNLGFAPFFNLPQGEHEAALKKAITSLKSPNTSKVPRSAIPYPRIGPQKVMPYTHLSILHPFFKSPELAVKTFTVAVLNWQPQIRKDVGIFEFQDNQMIEQVIMNNDFSSIMQNPFYSFKPLYLTAGVRPGMSGSPVFEYLDQDLTAQNNLLLGLVSKTLSFKNMTLLVPSNVVEQAISDILSQKPAPTEHSTYHFDAKRGQQYAVFQSRALGASFANTCDADFANSSSLFKQEKQPSSLKKGQGGDWGDGGGSSSDQAQYIYSAFFTDARHVPAITCTQSGVTDNNRNQYIAYKKDAKIFPLRNLDQFMNFKRDYDKSPDKTTLVKSSDLPQIKKSICEQYIGTKPDANFNLDLVKQYSEDTVRDASDGVAIPKGLMFRAATVEDAYFGCDENNRMNLRFTKMFRSLDNLITIDIRDQANQKAQLSLALGTCKISAEGKDNGFEYIFKHPLAEVRFFYEAPGRWALNIGQISESCGLSSGSAKSPAIRVDIFNSEIMTDLDFIRVMSL